jgi:hypothetical protein
MVSCISSELARALRGSSAAKDVAERLSHAGGDEIVDGLAQPGLGTKMVLDEAGGDTDRTGKYECATFIRDPIGVGYPIAERGTRSVELPRFPSSRSRCRRRSVGLRYLPAAEPHYVERRKEDEREQRGAQQPVFSAASEVV